MDIYLVCLIPAKGTQKSSSLILMIMCFVLQHGGTSVASLEIIGSGVLVQVNGKMYPRSTCVHLRGGDEVVFSNPGKHSYVSFYSYFFLSFI